MSEVAEKIQHANNLYSPRFGVHTILWGKSPQDMLEVLEYIHSAGFSGVEIFQHPDYLRNQFPDPTLLMSELSRMHLTVIGLCSGSLQQRVQFCLDYRIKPEYLYVDSLGEDLSVATSAGIKVAFHPHAYKQADLDATMRNISKDPQVKILLDPAHLAVMNRDSVELLDRVSQIRDVDGTPKLIAVHLKDWGGWYGRSFQRYAQGFTELGAGEVPLEDFFRTVLGQSPGIWAIIEQDHMTVTADSCISKSVKWINEQLAAASVKSSLRPVVANHSLVASGLSAPVDYTAAAEGVLHGILKAQESIETFAQFVCDLIQDWLKCPLVSLWEHTPAIRGGRMTILGSNPRGLPVGPMRATDSLPGAVVQSKETWFEPNILSVRGRAFSRPEVAEEYNLRSMLSVPILSSHNPNDVQAVLNIYFSESELERCLPHTEIILAERQGLTIRRYVDRVMTHVGEYIALALERILADRVLKAVSEVRTLSGKSGSRAEFLKKVLEVARKAVQAAAASVFVADSRKRLQVAASTAEVIWRLRQPYYGCGQGFVGQCFENDMEFVDDERPGQRAFSEERVDDTGSVACRVYVPLRDAGQCVGVLRCRNKIHPTSQQYFTQSDITVLQAISDAVIPRLRLFAAEERNIVMFRKMSHELKTPLAGVNSQLDFIEREASHVTFSQEWIREARDNTKLMSRLISNTEIIVRSLDSEFTPEPFSKHHLLGDVVYPVRDQMAAFLKRKQLDRSCIHVFTDEAQFLQKKSGQSIMAISNWKFIPALFLRLEGIQQVFFNLFVNAIKYGWRSAKEFTIDVVPSVERHHFVVSVKDWGIGIEEHERESIFDLGVRGKSANRYDPYGHGYGLAIVREIMQDHGGDVRLASLRTPTEFRLLFPRDLALGPPR